MEKFVRKLSNSSNALQNHNFWYTNVSKYNLNKEIDRRRTFVENKWSNSHADFSDLAKLGFYFYEKPIRVKCYFCNVDLSEFEGIDILKEHLRWSPNCPLLRRRITENEPINAEELDKILPPVSYDECGSKRKKSRAEDDVAYPEYRLTRSRFESFETWPIGLSQKPQELAEAGFFYSGHSDATICFSCGLFVVNWEPNDIPWIEHKKLLATECSYLKMNIEKVKMCEKKVEDSNKTASTIVKKNNNGDSDNETISDTTCKICFVNKSSIVFLPCKHVAVCGECIFGIGNTCPICRSFIKESIKLFYA